MTMTQEHLADIEIFIRRDRANVRYGTTRGRNWMRRNLEHYADGGTFTIPNDTVQDFVKEIEKTSELKVEVK
jgi:hypothetical protein